MSSDIADAAFVSLAADLLEELAAGRALELAAGLEPSRSPDWRTLSPRQLGLAEAANPEYRQHGVTPDRPGAERHCDYCGSARAELVPGADGEDGAWLCRDERQCLARKEHRYPPRPDLVPEAVLSAVGLADRQLLPREPAAAQPAPAEPQQEEPQEGWQQPQGWQVSQYGAYDVNGQWHPALPRFDAYAHTLMHPANRSHLLSGQGGRPHYYAGANYVPPALYGAEPAQEGTSGQPGTDVPPDRELARRGMYEAARGAGGGVDVQLQQPQEPGGAPARPARPRPRSRRTRWR